MIVWFYGEVGPHIHIHECIYIFRNQAGVLYRDLKHEAVAECFRSDKARTVSFLDVF